MHGRIRLTADLCLEEAAIVVNTEAITKIRPKAAIVRRLLGESSSINRDTSNDLRFFFNWKKKKQQCQTFAQILARWHQQYLSSY